ncbi:hypothetical protein I4U23_004121 [Adineta vaga]|nr:hypothetical protein I4U23_004121 [Adineta vaga]
MFSIIDRKFSCAQTTCLPFSDLTELNSFECELACLAQNQCEALSFHRTTFNCQLFTDISKEIANMLVDNDTDTMIAITDTRFPMDPWKCGNMNIAHNADVGGPDYLENYPQQTYASCCNLCLTNGNCRGFTWGYPNNTDEWQRLNCWLKNANTPVNSLTGFVGTYHK